MQYTKKKQKVKKLEVNVTGMSLVKNPLNWRQISLVNRDIKIIIKVLSTRIKNVLPFLISSNQMVYVKNRFISESGRVISDILEISK